MSLWDRFFGRVHLDGRAVLETERLIAAGEKRRAGRLVERILAQLPAGWQPREETPDEVRIAFWDETEFRAFVTHYQTTGDPRTVLWTSPSYAKCAYLLGFLAAERGEWATAGDHIARGLGLEPDHPLLLCEMGMIFGHAGQLDASLECYRRACVGRPWAPPDWRAQALRGFGFTLIALQDFDGAERAFHDSLELEPGSPTALRELEVIAHLRETGEDPGAIVQGVVKC